MVIHRTRIHFRIRFLFFDELKNILFKKIILIHYFLLYLVPSTVGEREVKLIQNSSKTIKNSDVIVIE
eukprot:TRINITY_DN3121_c0_g1_i1.p1 TRINITY_DN3121_c0_g1~~TRINITY_DN3121_c0_g1_i1.p1  ORF type:complete len:68 (-),score=2.56 TRINITY_DN3121_c0_g1_i1:117-320(-)